MKKEEPWTDNQESYRESLAYKLELVKVGIHIFGKNTEGNIKIGRIMRRGRRRQVRLTSSSSSSRILTTLVSWSFVGVANHRDL
ncbi:hypothetical protein M0802_006674 [Mischocyttarus mexicanus]|nr:hypothetical protein M0802_006674 [Mischocyttarus mexicanus]